MGLFIIGFIAAVVSIVTGRKLNRISAAVDHAGWERSPTTWERTQALMRGELHGQQRTTLLTYILSTAIAMSVLVGSFIGEVVLG